MLFLVTISRNGLLNFVSDYLCFPRIYNMRAFSVYVFIKFNNNEHAIISYNLVISSDSNYDLTFAGLIITSSSFLLISCDSTFPDSHHLITIAVLCKNSHTLLNNLLDSRTCGSMHGCFMYLLIVMTEHNNGYYCQRSLGQLLNVLHCAVYSTCSILFSVWMSC